MKNDEYVVIGLIIVFIIAVASYGIALKGSVEFIDVTVDEKWTKYQNGEAKYLFSDIDGNVYSIGDSFWFFSFDASNRYAQIESGRTYTLKLINWRIPVLSMYKNAVEINMK